MTPALTQAVNEWRADALHLIRNPQQSTPSQRAIAWRFLRQWGLKESQS